MTIQNIDGTTSPTFQLNADTESGPVLKDESPGDSVLARRNNTDTGYIRDRGLPMVADADVEISRDVNDDIDRVTIWKPGSGRTIKLQELTLTRDGDDDVATLTSTQHDDAGTPLTGLQTDITLTRAGGDVITIVEVYS